MKPNFEIELLPEAVEFLEALDDKTRGKIYYNIKKHNLLTTMNSLRS
jgi:hypothetical protein